MSKIKKAGKEALNIQQRKFCELYSSEKEFFANGVESYLEAYNPERKGNWYKSAASCAYRLLIKVDILLYIDELLELKGLNDKFVDKQLELLITQNADFKSKLGGIKEYNELKKRIQKNLKIDAKLTGDLSVLLQEIEGKKK